MAHKLLSEILPRDIVDFCISPFTGVSEETVRTRHKAVMDELERGSLKGMTGCFYIGMHEMSTDQRIPAEFRNLLSQNMNEENDEYLLDRRELHRYGHTLSDIDTLQDDDIGLLLGLQHHFSGNLKKKRNAEYALNYRDDSAAEQIFLRDCDSAIASLELQHLADSNEINDYGDRELRLKEKILPTADTRRYYHVKWLVGITTAGHHVCRRLIASSVWGIFIRHPRCMYVTPEHIVRYGINSQATQVVMRSDKRYNAYLNELDD